MMEKMRFAKSLALLPMLTLAMLLWSGAGLFAGGGELVIFLGDAKQAVNKDFAEKYLPQIKKMAETQGIQVREKLAAKGAPAAVTATPAIFFQNHLGRSRFLGRYHSLDKLQNFVRTVSRIPQADVPNEKHDVLVWQVERARVYSPIKFTALAGDVPSGLDQAAFHRDALAALARGASNAQFKELFPATRSDRAMYLALYPYRGTDGKFFLSAELYSQFNCVDPLMRWFDKPFSGNFTEWQSVVELAGKTLQTEIFKQLASTTRGDGMVPVPSKTAVKEWDALGLPLPAAPEGGASAVAANVPLGRRWQFGGPVDPSIPILNFNFLAPVDNYAGEIKEMFGDLEFADGPSLDNSLGKFGIETKSLTMGDPGLDAHVKEMIAMVEHPQATFTFEQMLAVEQGKLAFGAVSQFTVRGNLHFMGIDAPVDVTGQMEPVLDEKGAPAIVVNATFSLNLLKERYKLDGPDGPAPANNTIQFFLNFLLKPKA